MFAAAFFAASVLHVSAPSPAAQLAAVQRTATFHVLVLPDSMRLLRAEALHDGSAVRLEYSIENAVINVEERPPITGETPFPDAGQLFNLNGYPAAYRESNTYRGLSALAWYRSDLTIVVSSRDRVNAPLLVDIALELR